MQIRRAADGHYHWPARVNGHAVDFLVDTGATRSALPAALARELGLPAEGRVRSQTAGGAVEGQVVRADLELQGGVRVERLRIVALPALDAPLLGMDVLGKLHWRQSDGVLSIDLRQGGAERPGRGRVCARRLASGGRAAAHWPAAAPQRPRIARRRRSPRARQQIAGRHARRARPSACCGGCARTAATSYLFGTIHVGKLPWSFPGPQLRQALERTDVLALELDLDRPAVARACAPPAPTPARRPAAGAAPAPGARRWPQPACRRSAAGPASGAAGR